MRTRAPAAVRLALIVHATALMFDAIGPLLNVAGDATNLMRAMFGLRPPALLR
jgi:hypothetical protein